MGKQKLVEYFEDVETIEEYNGYFCSIPKAISIVVLGSICGLRNQVKYTNGRRVTK